MASNQDPAVPYWVAQLNSPPAAKSKVNGIIDPPGFSGAPSAAKKGKDLKTQPRKPPSAEERDTLKLKKAWEVALAPVKGLPMTAIMMYMSGNSLQIFSIMMVFMAFKNPIVGLMSTNQAFERFQTDSNSGQILQTKAVYVAMQFLALAVGIWKINSMGLLPTTRSDWLMWENLREPVEHAILAL
ncbi:ER membrane protein complex subunit 4 [Trichoderma simmonsii]|uniref:ER membrane protein complex subunit 4 n=1 Tax=Trichoderma simmonsii TaxID=1491479 RepID=A0A8G0PAR7_9HYPO|nr:ER membrane protein complex subunit 4 [Trichoderma simmonsii]